MTPLGDKLLVKQLPYRQPANGIVIPEPFLNTMLAGDTKVFEVIAVGSGRVTKKGVRVPIECAPGDRVITKCYDDGPVPLEDGQQIITERQILAVIPRI